MPTHDDCSRRSKSKGTNAIRSVAAEDISWVGHLRLDELRGLEKGIERYVMLGADPGVPERRAIELLCRSERSLLCLGTDDVPSTSS